MKIIMKPKFKQQPLCEVCGLRPAISFSYFKPHENKQTLDSKALHLITPITTMTPKQILAYDEHPDKLPDRYLHSGGNWMFTCECTSDHEHYYVMLTDFFKTPASTVDWLAHLHHKPWMNWENFNQMMFRFRKATNSFNSL